MATTMEKLRWIVLGALLLHFLSYFLSFFPLTNSSIFDNNTSDKILKNMHCLYGYCFCRPGYIGTTCSLGVSELAGQTRLQELELSELKTKLEEHLLHEPKKKETITSTNVDAGASGRVGLLPHLNQNNNKAAGKEDFSTLQEQVDWLTKEVESLKTLIRAQVQTNNDKKQ